MTESSDDKTRKNSPGRSTQAVLAQDAARIGAELVRLDGGTDPFAAAVRATRMPMIVTDPRQPDNPVVFVNDSFVRLTGYAREEILGRNCRFLQGPETDPVTVARIRAAVAARQSIEIDVRNHRKDGEPFWNRLLLAPVRDAQGEVAYFFASQVDVTLERERLAGLESHNAALLAEIADRMRAQEESTTRLRVAVEAGEIGEWELDLATDTSIRAPRHDEIFGYRDPPEDWGLKTFISHVVAEDRAVVEATFQEAATMGKEWRFECRIRRKDGVVRWIRVASAPILGVDGWPVKFVGIVQDVTEAREAEVALRRANDVLESRVAERTAELREREGQLAQVLKMEAVGQLAGGFAHDVNNMLQGISAAVELLWRRVAEERLEEAARFADTARQSVARAGALTNRLLAFSRRQTLIPTSLGVDTLVADMADLVRHTLGSGIELTLERHDGLWAVRGDASGLENAILNLAINARDAMPGGGRLRIETAHAVLGPLDVAGFDGAAPGEYVRVTVADTGAGMTPDVLAHAFEPFFTTKPLGKGTGLGLSQVYGFVRQSGGIVRIESVPGQGTAVHLFLPHHLDEAAPENDARPAAAEGADAPLAGTVLLVEDEAEVRTTAAAALRDLGCAVAEAGDAAEGLAALRRMAGGYAPGVGLDLLMTDVGLPGGMNGRQLADAARELLPGLPVLLITGYAGDAVAGDGLPKGMQLLAKPFDLDALAEAVRAALG